MNKIPNTCTPHQPLVTLTTGSEQPNKVSQDCREGQPRNPNDRSSYQVANREMSRLLHGSGYRGQLVQLAHHQTASAYRHEPEYSSEQDKESAFKTLKRMKNAGEITDAQWLAMAKALTGEGTQPAAPSCASESSQSSQSSQSNHAFPEQASLSPSTEYSGECVEPSSKQAEQPVSKQTPPVAMSFRAAANVLLQHFSLTAASDGDRGLINRKDLEAIQNQPGFSQELKQAAQVFLQNPALFNAVDIAGDWLKRHDGEIHTNDLRAFLADPDVSKVSSDATASENSSQNSQKPPTMDVDTAVRVLVDNFSWFASATGDRGMISKQDLESVLKQPGLSENMKQAARTLLDNPSFFNTLDNAGDLFGRSDGQIHINDLAAYRLQKAWGMHRT